MQATLRNLLRASIFLSADSSNLTYPVAGRNPVDDILRQRLNNYYEAIETPASERLNLQDAQLEIALCSLNVLEQIHEITSTVKEDAHDGGGRGRNSKTGESENTTVLGTRDMSSLRTLLGLVLALGTGPIVKRLGGVLSASRKGSGVLGGSSGGQLVSSSSSRSTPAEDFKLLLSLSTRLLHLLFTDGPDPKPPVSTTFIAASLMNRHATDLLRVCLVAGWVPPSLLSQAGFPQIPPNVRSLTLRFLASLPASQAITSLGSILATSPMLPLYVRKTCSSLLSRQVLSPYGINGLLSAMFGETEGTQVDGDSGTPLNKLEHVAKVLRAVPGGMPPKEYYEHIIPRLITLLNPSTSTRTPRSHTRAAAFTLSRLLNAEDPAFPHYDITSPIVLRILHEPLLEVTPTEGEELTENMNTTPQTSSSTPDVLRLPPLNAIQTLTVLLTHTDPSPTLTSTLLLPIVPSLYSLYEHFALRKISDPELKEMVIGLLTTWVRLAGREECIRGVWAIVCKDDEEYGKVDVEWQTNLDGEIRIVEKSLTLPSLTLADLAHMASADPLNDAVGSFDEENSNPLGLRPDPIQFVKFLQAIGRTDIPSEIFVKLLEAYQERRRMVDARGDSEEGDPMRTLLYLQLVMQMRTRFEESGFSKSLLQNSTHILAFIKHALEPSSATLTKQRQQKSPNSLSRGRSGLTLQSLRIVDEDEEEMDVDEDVDGDSDDEDAPGLEGVARADEMTVTAVNLLLSVLESNESLSARTAPILNDIFSLLEPLTSHPSESIRAISREARLVMTARLASTSASGGSFSGKKGGAEGEGESAQETYQHALKLLQDPILPVRAHGLMLLRQLVAPRSSSSSNKIKSEGGRNPPPLDRALIPAILSIFMECVQDEDSYLFLNAVQGLSAMVEGFGKEVLKGLVRVYLGGSFDGVVGPGLGGGGRLAMTRKDVDVVLRVGEALGQVVRRCGEALPDYHSILIPPLLYTLRSSHLPTTIRMSAVSLLAVCAGTNVRVFWGGGAGAAEMEEVVGTMVDLVMVESRGAASTSIAGSEKHVEERRKGSVGTDSAVGGGGAGTVKVESPEDSGLGFGTGYSSTRAGASNTPQSIPNVVMDDGRTDGDGGGYGGGGQGSDLGFESPNRVGDGDMAASSSRSDATNDKDKDINMDPTSTDSTLPPSRRAAIHFLTVLVKACTRKMYERFEVAASRAGAGVGISIGGGVSVGDASRFSPFSGYSSATDLGPEMPFTMSLVRRMKTVLGYVGMTDVDERVRVMVRECAGAVEEMVRAGLVGGR